MADSPVRVALVGLGGHGRNLQRAAEAVDAVEVVAVYDPDADEAQAAATRFACPPARSYDELVATETLEAVVLATPNAVHRVQAEQAIAAGLDVFVEKPIANTVADGYAIVQAAEAGGRVLMVGHNIRYGRAARGARARIDRGEIGEVVSVEIHYSADNVQKGTYGGWRFVPGACPLLPMMQLGIHAIDLAQYLVGPVARVAAHSRSVLTEPGVDDNVTALLTFASGVVGTAVSNYCTPDLFSVRVAGTRGVLLVDWIPHQLVVHPRGARTVAPETEDYATYEGEDLVRELAAFAEAVRTRTPPETDGRVGLAALAAVEAMRESAAADGRAVWVRQADAGLRE